LVIVLQRWNFSLGGAFAFDGLLTLVGFFIDLILGFTPVFSPSLAKSA
jgi:hypothetical protein